MSSKLVEKIYKVIKDFNDPVTKIPLDRNNENFNITSLEGKISISLDIEENNKKKYEGFVNELKDVIIKLDDIETVNIVLTAQKKTENKENKRSRFQINAKNIIAIASGKGGVGKSTFSVNYAAALKQIGFNVGILDADIYGPSIPRMMGINEKPKVNDDKKFIPLENFGVKLMSIGFLVNVETPAIWRGPMIMKALEQMYNGVDWGKLDYLIIDLPPGTGDAQISLAQNSKLTGAIIISTPQDVALIDARKGINMFRKVDVPIIGIVENMSYFICNECNTKHEIFSTGGAKLEAKKFETSFLGDFPIDINLRIQSDAGTPLCVSNPESITSQNYIKVAKVIEDQLKTKRSSEL